MDYHLLVFSVGRILQTRPDIFRSQVGKVRKNLLGRHARR
jgi:hypothetical protein